MVWWIWCQTFFWCLIQLSFQGTFRPTFAPEVRKKIQEALGGKAKEAMSSESTTTSPEEPKARTPALQTDSFDGSRAEKRRGDAGIQGFAYDR